MCKSIIFISSRCIPHFRSVKRSNKFIKNSTLSNLCWQSRIAFRQWKEAGRPSSGPEYLKRKECKRKVADFLAKCRAQLVRKEIQKRDELFRTKDLKRFSVLRPKCHGSNLVVNGKHISDSPSVLDAWANHFSTLSESSISSNSHIQEYLSQLSTIESESFSDLDSILDCSIDVEEVNLAIAHLKCRSASGIDSISPSHLKHTGPLFRRWLCSVFNALISFEEIPLSFKFGLVIPIYKGKGKDPLLPGSYRGITLSSVLVKTLEFVLLERILPVLSDRGIPQLTQTAYQKGISCSDAIFSCLEVISKYTREGDSVYSCFYDLASAFDTIEYPVLLTHLYHAGIVGKTWRLLKSWYSNSTSCVRIDGCVSREFPINRGVKQGSVLSPVLFILVMDPLLVSLRHTGCGLNLGGLYLGVFCHADDIRTLSSSNADCCSQIDFVESFVTSRGLSLNVEKSEAVIFHPPRTTPTLLSGTSISIPVTDMARCLGAYWTSNLSSSKWIDVNIKKARNAFFARGKDLFHGKLNPLSSKSIIECYIMPVLLYGAESWILNISLLKKLESFQCELAKRILRLSASASNRACRVVLHWPSIRARVLCAKLCYLLKLLNGGDTLSCRVFRTLAATDIEEIHLVKQCRFLESQYGLDITTELLSSPATFSPSIIKKSVIKSDHNFLLKSIASDIHLKFIADVEINLECSWLRVWDFVLDYGPHGTTCVMAILKLLCLRSFANSCPISNCNNNLNSQHLGDHFLSCHTNLNICIKDCVSALSTCSASVIDFGVLLISAFKCNGL